MKKRYIFLLILLVIIGGIYFVFANLEGIVKTAVNKYGSEVTGTEVKLDGFGLSLLKGEVQLKGLTVANPKGYTKPYLFSLDRVFVKLDIKSLTTDTIVVNEITIEAPEMTYEMLSITRNNITDILKNVEANTKSSEPEAVKPVEEKKVEKADKKADKPAKKIVIDKVSINGVKLDAHVQIMGKSASKALVLPNVLIKDIGKGNKETNIVDASVRIMKEILTQATKSITDGMVDLKALAQENLNKVKDEAKAKIEAEKEKAKEKIDAEKAKVRGKLLGKFAK